jgi:lipoteichoic acid synthase
MSKTKLIVGLICFGVILSLGCLAKYFHLRIPVENCLELFYVVNFGNTDSLFGKSSVSIHKPIIIQHGGGSYNRGIHRNTLEALDENYAKGERFFELDFDMTSDNELVCIHGWIDEKDHWIIQDSDGLDPLTFAALSEWLSFHPDAYIITDVKNNNIKALSILAGASPNLKSRFIPQIFRLREYKKVRELGFSNIIFTLYFRDYSDEIVLSFAIKFPLFAVTMWGKRALHGTLVKKLNETNTTVYAHTINDKAAFDSLRKAGVYGVYTDYLHVE